MFGDIFGFFSKERTFLDTNNARLNILKTNHPLLSSEIIQLMDERQKAYESAYAKAKEKHDFEEIDEDVLLNIQDQYGRFVRTLEYSLTYSSAVSEPAITSYFNPNYYPVYLKKTDLSEEPEGKINKNKIVAASLAMLILSGTAAFFSLPLALVSLSVSLSLIAYLFKRAPQKKNSTPANESLKIEEVKSIEFSIFKAAQEIYLSKPTPAATYYETMVGWFSSSAQ